MTGYATNFRIQKQFSKIFIQSLLKILKVFLGGQVVVLYSFIIQTSRYIHFNIKNIYFWFYHIEIIYEARRINDGLKSFKKNTILNFSPTFLISLYIFIGYCVYPSICLSTASEIIIATIKMRNNFHYTLKMVIFSILQ